jgi:hypothetical protein
LEAEISNLTHVDLNTIFDKLENWWDIHLVSYDIVPSRAKPTDNGQLSVCS